MTVNIKRSIRKAVYGLGNRKGPIGRLLLRFVLASYRYYDLTVLDRANTPDLGSEKVILFDKKLLYVAVPKVATRSIIDALLTRTVGASSPTVFESDIVTLVREHPAVGSFFKFTIVRNPWSRITSCYRDKIMVADPIKRARHLNGRYGLEPGMPFAAFVEWLNSPEGSDDVADRHWMSQFRILAYDRPDLIRYNFVGRFERLEDDYRAIQAAASVKLPDLPHRLKTQEPKDYRLMYDDCTAELVARRYARDIELFEYRFDQLQ